MDPCKIRGHRDLITKCAECDQIIDRSSFKDLNVIEWISVNEEIPKKAFAWRDDITGQKGIGSFDEERRVFMISSGGTKQWIFKDWTSITHWRYLE